MSPNSFEVSTFLLVSLSLVFGLVTLITCLSNQCNSRSTQPFGKLLIYSSGSMGLIYLSHIFLEASIRTSRKGLYRWECLHSRKGGKRPFGDVSEDYRNPCYNYTAEESGVDKMSMEDSSTQIFTGGVSNSLCSSKNCGNLSVQSA